MITPHDRYAMKQLGPSFNEETVRLAAIHCAQAQDARTRVAEADTFLDTVYQIRDGEMIVCPTCGADQKYGKDVQPCAAECGTYLCLGCDEDAENIIHEAEGFDELVFCSTCAESCTACEDEKGRPTGGGNQRRASLDSIASGEAWVPCRQCEGTPGVVIKQRAVAPERTEAMA